MTSSLIAKVFERRKGLPWQTLGDQTLVIEPKEQNSHELSGCGSLIWELMDGQRSVEQIVQCLSEAYEAESSDIGVDVEEFVHALAAKGLVELVR